MPTIAPVPVVVLLEPDTRVAAIAGKDWFLANQTGRYKAIVAGGKASYDYVLSGPYTREQAVEKARTYNHENARLRRPGFPAGW